MENYIKENKYFVGKFLFMNTAFNLKSQFPEEKYLESHIWLTFSYEQGSEAFIELANYTIVTDENFWPGTQNEVKTGHYLSYQNTASFSNE